MTGVQTCALPIFRLLQQYPQLIPHAYVDGYNRTTGGLAAIDSERRDLDKRNAELAARIKQWADLYGPNRKGCPTQ